jgi:predicted DNA-binding transcriptional regulator AlpA
LARDFLSLTSATDSCIIKMKKYSVSEVAKLLDVNRATVYRWLRKKLVPPLIEEVVAGVRVTYWTDKELAKVSEYKATHYYGKGVDRRTGKTAKHQKM